MLQCPCCRKPSRCQGQRQLWHCRSLRGKVSCRAQRPWLSLKESLAMKERRWSLLCCHHTVRRLAAAQISLLRECESKWHVIWMLMKIFSCFRLQIPSRKLSSGRHCLPSSCFLLMIYVFTNIYEKWTYFFFFIKPVLLRSWFPEHCVVLRNDSVLFKIFEPVL